MRRPGHYASYGATAPIRASSSPTKRRVLNPRGDRQRNWAIHIVAVSQISHPSPGRGLYERAEGESPEGAIRALKRRLSDVI